MHIYIYIYILWVHLRPRIWSNVWAPAQMLSLWSSSSRLRGRESWKQLESAVCVVVFVWKFMLIQNIDICILYIHVPHICMYSAQHSYLESMVVGTFQSAQNVGHWKVWCHFRSRRHFLQVVTASLFGTFAEYVAIQDEVPFSFQELQSNTNIPADSKPAPQKWSKCVRRHSEKQISGVKTCSKKGQRSFSLCTLTALLVQKRAE